MADMQNQIQAAYDMVDRRQNDAALKLIDEIFAGLEPPNRMAVLRARPILHALAVICLSRSLCPWPTRIRILPAEGPLLRSALALGALNSTVGRTVSIYRTVKFQQARRE